MNFQMPFDVKMIFYPNMNLLADVAIDHLSSVIEYRQTVDSFTQDKNNQKILFIYLFNVASLFLFMTARVRTFVTRKIGATPTV